MSSLCVARLEEVKQVTMGKAIKFGFATVVVVIICAVVVCCLLAASGHSDIETSKAQLDRLTVNSTNVSNEAELEATAPTATGGETQAVRHDNDQGTTSKTSGPEFDRLSPTQKAFVRDAQPITPCDAHCFEKIKLHDNEDKTLRQVLLLHRHGDRTPLGIPENDPLKNETFWDFHGRGQLTNRGKTRLHLLGRLIRARYDSFLNSSLSKHNVFTRTSGILRCTESALSFLSGFLALDMNNNPEREKLIWNKNSSLAHIWQPTAIETNDASIDGMLSAYAVCKNCDKEMYAIGSAMEVKSILTSYKDIAQLLNELYGLEMHYYSFIHAIGYLEPEMIYFPEGVPKRVVDNYERVQEASNLAFKLYPHTTTLKRLYGGLLIDNMVENMKCMSESTNTKRVLHYSAHDSTVTVLMGILSALDQLPARPDFGSTVVLELHEDVGKHQWFVKAFYMHHIPSELVELQLKACERDASGRCNLSAFMEFVSPFRVDSWQSWMKECDNDLKKVDPYKSNY